MLSELEKELGRVRYKQERDLFLLLDEFFENPSDENLSVLQTLRHDHKESVAALDKARRERRDADEAAAKMAAASAAISYVSSTATPTSASIDAKMDEMRARANARIDELQKRVDEDRKKTASANRSWFEKLLGD